MIRLLPIKPPGVFDSRSIQNQNLIPRLGEVSRSSVCTTMQRPPTALPGPEATAMTSSLLPVSVLAFVLVSYIALRPFSLLVRRVFDMSCFLGATAILWQHQTSPLPGAGAAAISPWLHAVAAVWWLLGARVLVALLSFTLNHNQRWREARLFPDLTAASIYAAAVLVVLISVLSLPIGGLLATSGVLAIVLGLALQNTLADVFAGISFGIESPSTSVIAFLWARKSKAPWCK